MPFLNESSYLDPVRSIWLEEERKSTEQSRICMMENEVSGVLKPENYRSLIFTPPCSDGNGVIDKTLRELVQPGFDSSMMTGEDLGGLG